VGSPSQFRYGSVFELGHIQYPVQKVTAARFAATLVNSSISFERRFGFAHATAFRSAAGLLVIIGSEMRLIFVPTKDQNPSCCKWKNGNAKVLGLSLSNNDIGFTALTTTWMRSSATPAVQLRGTAAPQAPQRRAALMESF
jgi:hypothetical protein